MRLSSAWKMHLIHHHGLLVLITLPLFGNEPGKPSIVVDLPDLNICISMYAMVIFFMYCMVIFSCMLWLSFHHCYGYLSMYGMVIFSCMSWIFFHACYVIFP